jgi:hypothetical protein
MPMDFEIPCPYHYQTTTRNQLKLRIHSIIQRRIGRNEEFSRKNLRVNSKQKNLSIKTDFYYRAMMYCECWEHMIKKCYALSAFNLRLTTNSNALILFSSSSINFAAF